MNPVIIFLFVASFTYLFYLILKHRQSRSELGKGVTKTAFDTVYTFSKGTLKTMFRASKSAIRAENRSRKQRKKNNNRA